MNKVIVDTCLYIEWFKGNFLEHSTDLLSKIPYLSSVVATELLAGAHSKPQQRELNKFISRYEEANRVLSPSHLVCVQAGKCIQKMGIQSKSILGDSLIAMSAKSIGAEVWTLNKKDFMSINSVVKFKLHTIKSS